MEQARPRFPHLAHIVSRQCKAIVDMPPAIRLTTLIESGYDPVMTKHAAKVLSEYRRLSPEDKDEVFGAIVSEPRTPERQAELDRQSFHVQNEEAFKAAVQAGLEQSKRGEVAPLDLKEIRKKAHARLTQRKHA